MDSKLYSINWKDAIKGFVVAAITAFLSAILAAFEAGGFPSGSQLKTAGIVGLTAGLAYLVKNFFSAPPTPPPAG